MGVLKMGTIGLDGTKIHANASRHSSLSYEYAGRLEEQLKAEVADLLAKAEAFLRKIAERTVTGLLNALEACAEIFKPDECLNYFKACGYDTDCRSPLQETGRRRPPVLSVGRQNVSVARSGG